MDYFQAVQIGKERLRAAMEVLQKYAGPCYPVLFLKMGVTEWTPVGQEMLSAIVQGKGGRAALTICDSDGNAKAMTSWIPESQARDFVIALERAGIQKFDGVVKLPI